MRARFIHEKFTEESDPIKDMGVGTMDVKMDIMFLKKLYVTELEELYKRVHNQQHANVIVDGVKFDALPHYSKIRINNLVVDALKYKRNIAQRDKVRSQGFKSGDAIKCQIKGEWVMGYPEFSKRGIIKTDSYGRIVAKTLTGIIKVPLKFAIKLTPKEQKEFDKQYFAKIKDQLERTMNIYKDWSSSRYKKAKEEYDEFIKTFKNKKIKLD